MGKQTLDKEMHPEPGPSNNRATTTTEKPGIIRKQGEVFLRTAHKSNEEARTTSFCAAKAMSTCMA